MPLVVPVAHDFVCEWCWIGMFQSRRMRRCFSAEIEWRPYELYPDEVRASKKDVPTRPPHIPPVPTRAELAFAAEGLDWVVPRAGRVSTHAAHEAVEFAKQFGPADAFVERIYFAYWRDGLDISDLAVLRDLARGVVPDIEGLADAVERRRYADRIVPFDSEARKTGVWHIPTFWIGGERHSEQPWPVLERAFCAITGADAGQPRFYGSLDFPLDRAPKSRPYTFINMVTTVDGKIVTGERGEEVNDLGSELDHKVMRLIQSSADAVLIGAGSQRSSAKITYPSNLLRFVVTRSGNLLYDSRFFEDDPQKAIIVCPESAKIPAGYSSIRVGATDVDLRGAFRRIREEFGVQRLLVEGGSDLNAQALALDLIDELFLTIAPKVRLGKDVPTYADGEPLSRADVQNYALIEEHRAGDEVFLRYRRQ